MASFTKCISQDKANVLSIEKLGQPYLFDSVWSILAIFHSGWRDFPLPLLFFYCGSPSQIKIQGCHGKGVHPSALLSYTNVKTTQARRHGTPDWRGSGWSPAAPIELRAPFLRQGSRFEAQGWLFVFQLPTICNSLSICRDLKFTILVFRSELMSKNT